jgi:hypothetical protein
LNLNGRSGDHIIKTSFEGVVAMLANILLFVFVGSFIAIVALGHVLLVTAIWPEPFRIRRDPHLDSVPGGNQRLHQPR